MLLGLTLLALLMLALFSGLRTGARSWEAVDESLQSVASVRAVSGMLDRQLGQARLVMYPGERGETPYFRGTTNSVEFVAPMMTHLVEGGLMLVRLSHEDGALWLRMVPYLPDEGVEEGLDEVEGRLLIDDVESLELRYFGRPTGRIEEREWVDEWPLESPRIPSLMRVEFPVEGVEWPPMIIRVGGA